MPRPRSRWGPRPTDNAADDGTSRTEQPEDETEALASSNSGEDKTEQPVEGDATESVHGWLNETDAEAATDDAAMATDDAAMTTAEVPVAAAELKAKSRNPVCGSAQGPRRWPMLRAGVTVMGTRVCSTAVNLFCFTARAKHHEHDMQLC